MRGMKCELIQLTRKGVVLSGSAADLRALRARFQPDHYIILPKLIERDLFATILKRIESAPSVQKEFNGIIAQSIIGDPLLCNMLFLVSIPEFQRFVQRITECRRIADFQGRVYRLNPSTGNRIIWHTNVCDYRMLTFSLNLTTLEYQGGTLQIRGRSSEEILHEVRNTGQGDALFMRGANKLFHRVLPVGGDVPRNALTGWFRWEKGNENFHGALRKASRVPPETESAASGARND